MMEEIIQEIGNQSFIWPHRDLWSVIIMRCLSLKNISILFIIWNMLISSCSIVSANP